jgi:transposase
MDTSNHPTFSSFVGIDIAKDSLDIYVSSNRRSHTASNSLKGYRKLIRHLPEPGRCLIVMEATGSYQKPVAMALCEVGHFVAVVNPRQVRCFAHGIGVIAKTDRIDAKVLAAYAEQVRPRTMEKPRENQGQIADLVARRRQLVELRTAEKNRSKQARQKAIRKSIEQMINCLDDQINAIDDQIQSLIESDETWSEQAELLKSVPGIGAGTAASLAADLPELGHLNRQEIAALAGLAPYNRDSGRFRGKRSIWGGRRTVRTAIYMATISAKKCNPIIRNFAERLKAQGKAAKVITTACMRKLLVILNTMVKNNTHWNPKIVCENP